MAAAIFLWQSAAHSGRAATADASPPQGTSVSVDKTISWGDAGSCTQNMADADFGNALPGTSKRAGGFKGCVTSNAAPWRVTALATRLAVAPGVMIPLENEKLAVTGSSNADHAVGECDASNATAGCTLGTGAVGAVRSVIINGGVGTGSFDYGYSLDVPAGQAAGSYSNTVTFTAAN